jgi:hypothetical protein
MPPSPNIVPVYASIRCLSPFPESKPIISFSTPNVTASFISQALFVLAHSPTSNASNSSFTVHIPKLYAPSGLAEPHHSQITGWEPLDSTDMVTESVLPDAAGNRNPSRSKW